MKKVIMFFVLALIFTKIDAQAPKGGGYSGGEGGIITGIVIDGGLKTPIEYANLVLYKQSDSSLVTGTITDATGKFVIKDVTADKYFLTANFIGYNKTNIANIEINKTNSFKMLDTIYLSQASEELKEVEITGTKSYIKYEIDKKVLNVSQSPNGTTGSAADVLEGAPSIQVDVDGNVSLRGSTNFKVLIDGKPSVLSANDILQQTPASMIESIEIITNPSAKYDPEGNSGIINLVTKKKSVSGFNGIFNVGVGSYGGFTTDFLFNYKIKKINFFVGANYNDTPHLGTGYFERTTYGDIISKVEADAQRERLHGGYSAKTGIDYYINDKNTLSLSSNVGKFIFGMSSDTYYSNWTEPQTYERYFISSSNKEVDNDYINTDLTYQHKFAKKDHTLDIYFFYSNNIGNDKEELKDIYTNSEWELLGTDYDAHTSKADDSGYGSEFKIDYIYPINDKSKLEAGYNLELYDANYSYIYKIYNNTIDNWEEDPSHTNQSNYTNHIEAIYSTYTSEIKGFGYQIGLRAEYSERLFTQKTTNEKYPYNKISLFPSAYISKTLSHEQEIQLSYSRRIMRPDEWTLNPFPIFSDQFSVMYGNPLLNPQYTDSYELNYQKYFGRSSISVETFYRNSTDAFARITELTDDGLLATKFENANQESTLGVEAMASLMLFKMLMLNPSVSFYQYNVKGVVDSQTQTAKSTNADIRLMTMLMLGRNTKLSFTTFYSAPSTNLQGETKYRFGAMASFKQEFFKKKLSLSVSGRNVLGTMKFQFSTKGEGYEAYNIMKPKTSFMINLSYKINNYTKRNFETDNNMNIDL